VVPELEQCNLEDDDCDGFVDEGVESPCGGCNADCQGGVWGSLAAPFEVSQPLAVTGAGELTLAWQPSAARTLWVANTDEGSVSKIDVQSAQEVARYRTRGAYPIHVAVDHRGDAFVLDGTFGGTAHLTKIAADLTRCRGVKTSSGATDVLPVGEDECVLIDLPLAAADDPRSMSVDGALAPDSARAGDVWIGCAGTDQLLSLSGADGSELSRHDLSRYQLRPHASAFDLFGQLWLVDRAGKLLRFDPVDPAASAVLLVPYPCYSLDALSLDARGRLLLSGFGCERVFGYDPQRSQWRTAQMPDLLTPRGVVAGAEESWVGFSSGELARLARESLQPAAASPLDTPGFSPFETFALSADGFGQLWAISTQGGPDGVGLATRFDPKAGRVSAQVPLGKGPRAGGDLTGSASGGEFARVGRASHVFAGCGREGRETDAVSQAQTEWLNLRVTALLGAGARVVISVRHAESIEALADTSYEQLSELPRDTGPFALQLPAGGAIEVMLDLESNDAIGAPRVARVGVEWRCPGPL
jgi:streptogramin lyase